MNAGNGSRTERLICFNPESSPENKCKRFGLCTSLEWRAPAARNLGNRDPGRSNDAAGLLQNICKRIESFVLGKHTQNLKTSPSWCSIGDAVLAAFYDILADQQVNSLRSGSVSRVSRASHPLSLSLSSRLHHGSAGRQHLAKGFQDLLPASALQVCGLALGTLEFSSDFGASSVKLNTGKRIPLAASASNA